MSLVTHPWLIRILLFIVVFFTTTGREFKWNIKKRIWKESKSKGNHLNSEKSRLTLTLQFTQHVAIWQWYSCYRIKKNTKIEQKCYKSTLIEQSKQLICICSAEQTRCIIHELETLLSQWIFRCFYRSISYTILVEL